MALKTKTHGIDKASAARRTPLQKHAAAANKHHRPIDPVTALKLASSAHPSALRPAEVLTLQGAIGNRAVQRMLSSHAHSLSRPSATAANAIQRQTEEEERPHEKFDAAPRIENRTGMPDGLKSSIESLSGISLDHVRVHYGSTRPAQLDALAYTQGSDIHVAPGQERHLPHEAWHVVQQAQGRVQPTMQLTDGVPVNDDERLEHEADVMGAKAAQLKAVTQPADSGPRDSPIPLASGRVAQLKPPAPPGARTEKVIYSLGRSDTINFINKALVLNLAQVVGRPHSNAPLTHHTLTVFNSGNAAVISKQSGEAFITIDVGDLYDLADGQYWVRGVARTQAESTYYDEFAINVATFIPDGGSSLPFPIVGSQYLGSHWTSTAYRHSFMQEGIQTRGTSQARFGEGLYLTTDRGYGWKAGLSKIQEIRSGQVGEWGVYLRPGQTFEGMLDGNSIKEQFRDPPWRGTALAPYINNYDTIYDNAEKEIKVNPRAFAKVNLVSRGEYHPVTGERL